MKSEDIYFHTLWKTQTIVYNILCATLVHGIINDEVVHTDKGKMRDG